MTRSIRRIAAVLALAALAFAQLAVSAYACQSMGGMAAAGYESGEDATGTNLSNANLCEQHCEYGSASAETHAPVVPAPGLSPLSWPIASFVAPAMSSRAFARQFAQSLIPPDSDRLIALRI